MPRLDESKEFQDIVKSVKQLAENANSATTSTERLKKTFKDLSKEQQDFVKMAEGMGLIESATKATTTQLERLTQLLSTFMHVDNKLSEKEWLERYGKTALDKTNKSVNQAIIEYEQLAAEKKKEAKATQEQVAANDNLEKGLDRIITKLNQIKKSGLKVRVNNDGFQKVLNEMANAIDRFHERTEGATPRKRNFFDQMLGTRQENKDAGDQIVKEAKNTIKQVKDSFFDPLGANLTEKVSKAISSGIRNGVITGMQGLNEINPTNMQLAALADSMGISQFQRQRMIMNLLGKEDPSYIKAEQIKADAKLKEAKYKAKKNAEVRIATARDIRRTELEYEDTNHPEESAKLREAQYRKANAAAMREELALQKEMNKEKRDAVNRDWNKREQVRIEKELASVYGEEGSKVQKLGEEIVRLQAKNRQIIRQGDELNKLNFAEHANNLRRIQDTVRKWATEMYRVTHNTDTWINRFKAIQTIFTRIASMTQTFSAGISAVSGLWSNMRTAATSFFRFFTNGFRRAFSYVRGLATNTLKAGYEQREKIQQAQIGFASFFGKDRVDAVTRRVREEAAKTPIVDAGSLASYVQQLAPVAQGNASLAVNASLGILKGLVYSGSDISEGEYVIKNIRDVIAKGKATAIDIRQFNRALPGLEQALRESGQDAFLDKEGKLNITSKNVGKVLDLFAKLNTDKNSPLKNIEREQLKTLSGLQQLFKEKKTTAMETILEKSGFFDLMYDLLGVGTNDSMWSKLSDFLGNTLKPLISGIRNVIGNVDWNTVGENFSAFFKIVGEGISEAKDLVFGSLKNAFGGSDTKTMIQNAATLIKSFIVGFGKGMKDTIDFVSDIIKRLTKTFAQGDINKFVEMVGHYLVSPLGKLIQMMLGLSQNGLGAFSRMSAFIASGAKGLGDFVKWFGGMRATAFGNNFVAANKARLTDLTVEQMQAMLQGKTIPGIKAATKEVGTFGSKVKAGAAAVGSFVARVASALAVGGIIYMLGQGLGEAVKGMQLFGDASNDIARVIKAAATVIAGVVSGYMIGGVAGGFVGALVAATIAAKQFRDELRAEKKAADEERLAVVLSETQQKLADGIIKNMQESGLNVDTGTDAGHYARKKMEQYISQFDDPGMVDLAEAEKVFLDAMRFKQTMEDMYNYTNSNEYNNLGGNVIDLKTDSARRDKIAEIIRYFRLNGDNYDYDSNSAETIVKDWLNGDKLTDKQADEIISRFGGLYDEFGGSVNEMGNKIDNASDTMEEVMKSIDANTTEMDRLRSEIAYLGSSHGLFEGIAKDLLGYEGIASRGTYTTNGKTYGIADVWRFINDKIADIQTDESLTSEERDKRLREWAVLNRDVMEDYANNPDFDAGKWFRYMMQKYGNQGFRQFFNENGVAGDVNAYMDRIRNTGGTYFKDQYNWFYRFIQGHPNTGLKVGDNNDVDNGGKWSAIWVLSEADKKKLQDYTRDRAKDLIDQYWNQREEDVKKANEEARRREQERTSTSFQWWNPFTWFSNHGGITPIYRATGGLGVDTVPAMLQPGEFVMRRSAVAKAGLGTMFALNRGDMVSAARSLGSRFSPSYNNSRNWSNVVNNNQKTQSNYIKIVNKNKSGRLGSYYSLANRIALA